jgi:Protein kinase domain
MKAPQAVEVCPSCNLRVEGISGDPLSRVQCPQCHGEIIVSQKINNFELLGVLDHGERGIVYHARDLDLGRDIALKLLRANMQDTQLVRTLSSEAAAMGRVCHPNVVKVYSAGNDGERFYTAMELFSEGSLRDVVTRGGPIPERQVLEFAIQIAEGLQAAWNDGLIHGRVSPQNILFSGPTIAKIGNFGLAIAAEENAVYYDAPEILAEACCEHLPGDIYSLGATLIYALTGRVPFEAQTLNEKALRALKSRPVDLAAMGVRVSQSTAAVLRQMLRVDPAERFQSYEDLIAKLQLAKAELTLIPRATPAVGGSGARARAVQVPKFSSGLRSSSGVRPAPTQTMGGESFGIKEGEGKSRWWLWVLSAVVLLGLGATFMSRGRILESAKLKPNRKQLVASADVSDAIPANFGTDFAAASQLFASGQFSAAADGFRAVLDDSSADPMVVEWALFHEAMCRMASGNLEQGQQVFRRLKEWRTSGIPPQSCGTGGRTRGAISESGATF